jgi:hypothetical protein
MRGIMALKKKRKIIIRDAQLRQIRTNLRRLIPSACKAEQMKIHEEKENLNKQYYDERGYRRKDLSDDDNEKYKQTSKKLADQYWAFEQPLRDSIIECPVCFKSDKDMVYNPVRKVWYCTDCYEKLRRGNIERGTPEEFH